MLSLLEFFTEEGRFSRKVIILLIITSGVSGSFLLAVINAAAEQAGDESARLRYLLLFMLTLLLFTVTKRVVLFRATIAGERAIRETRIRLADKIRQSELLFIEDTGHGDLYARLTQDTATISQAVPMIFNGYQSSVLLLCGLVYVAVISWPAFLLTVGFLALGGFAYFRQSRLIVKNLKNTTKKEAQFIDAIQHLVGGFKEIKINTAKSNDVHAHLSGIAVETEQLMVSTGQLYVTHLVGTQAMTYLLIAIVVFILPTFDQISSQSVLELTAAGLFIVAPLEVILTAYYFYNKATVALKNIADLESRLDIALENRNMTRTPTASIWEKFQRITLSGVQFKYPGDRNGYSIGPLDLSIERGTITFITGGNGSGKSTLLKILMGLYTPDSGKLMVDGTPVVENNLPDYRELYSAIFGDFHLFDRLYGMRNINPTEVAELLREMEIADKTNFVNDAFTNLDLSTGQRKRLAMVIARLEAKPVYVFDEWAADQDPGYRRYFYKILLPRLKAEGKTIIVVTHDDAYFVDHADQLLKLDYGQLIPFA